MTNFFVTLGGATAERYLRLIARDYATHVCLSRLEGVRMWNEPWRAKGLSFGDWMRGVDAERLRLRAALESVVSGSVVPTMTVGIISWHVPDYTHIGKKQSYPSFSAERIRTAADRFASRYLAFLGFEVGPLQPSPEWLNEELV